MDFAIELCKMKVGTSESDLGRVSEDLAIILHAWCLNLAGPSLSLPLFLSPCVDVSAHLGLCLRTLSPSRSFCILISLCSLCLFMCSAVCR